MKYLPGVVSQNLDDSPDARSMKWTPDSANFVIDVRKALTVALENQPDVRGLAQAWARILADQSTIRETESRLVALVAPVFLARSLEPNLYFRKARFRHNEQRRAAA
jgi:hypothetical protein